jgi:thioredoxin-like negative regulator of GroEL
VHGLRFEYQDRVNFVIFDADLDRDRRLAQHLGIPGHPGFAVVAPDSDEVLERRFGPQPPAQLREWLDEIAARYAE